MELPMTRWTEPTPHSPDHPLRHRLTEEMHARRFLALTAPARVTQIVVIPAGADMTAARAHAEALCRRAGASAPPQPTGRYFEVDLGRCTFYWEQHSEFVTYSFIETGPFAEPFGGAATDAIPGDWLDDLPGPIFRATRMALLDRSAPEPTAQQLAASFSPGDLVCCDLLGGEARMWADFRLHGDGFGRLLIHDRALVGSDASRLVQMLQELGNYRKMALLGFPVAQELTPTLNRLEQRLAELTEAITSADATADDRLLGELSTLSAELARHLAASRYRMSATQAYAEIVADRLASLGVVRVAGHPTLADFTERRLTPAVRTCASVAHRLEDLSQRAAWASALMRTRVDTTLARQSRDLLASMDRRTDLQLRLQQTVEGLSVVAISYYLVGLVGYAAKALHPLFPTLDPAVVMGLAVPLLVPAVWLGMRRIRHGLHK